MVKFVLIVIAEDGTFFAYGPVADSRVDIWREDLQIMFPYAAIQVAPLRGARSLLF